MELLFDSDAGSNPASKRTFNVAKGCVAHLLASGLEEGECVPVYVRVGSAARKDCCGGDEADFAWAPLFRCGAPVQLCADSNEHIEPMPGTYMIGAPDVEPTFAGDVNVSMQKLGNDFMHVKPGCAGGDLLDQTLCPPDAFLGTITDLSLLSA